MSRRLWCACLSQQLVFSGTVVLLSPVVEADARLDLLLSLRRVKHPRAAQGRRVPPNSPGDLLWSSNTFSFTKIYLRRIIKRRRRDETRGGNRISARSVKKKGGKKTDPPRSENNSDAQKKQETWCVCPLAALHRLTLGAGSLQNTRIFRLFQTKTVGAQRKTDDHVLRPKRFGGRSESRRLP